MYPYLTICVKVKNNYNEKMHRKTQMFTPTLEVWQWLLFITLDFQIPCEDRCFRWFFVGLNTFSGLLYFIFVGGKTCWPFDRFWVSPKISKVDFCLKNIHGCQTKRAIFWIRTHGTRFLAGEALGRHTPEHSCRIFSSEKHEKSNTIRQWLNQPMGCNMSKNGFIIPK